MTDFLSTYDTDSLLRNILSREVSQYGVSRIPFWFGSTKSTGIRVSDLVEDETFRINFEALRKMLRLKVNPNSIEITPYIRFAESRTNAGRIYYHWVNEEGKAVDIYEISMRGQTGNLLPGNAEAKRKLYLWMKLRELSYEPRVFKSTEITEDRVRVGPEFQTITSEKTKEIKNEFFIFVRTVSLPTLIMFTGFFKTPIVITERAEDQYNIEWSFTFGVTNVYPRLETLSKVAMIPFFPQLLHRVFGET